MLDNLVALTIRLHVNLYNKTQSNTLEWKMIFVMLKSLNKVGLSLLTRVWPRHVTKEWFSVELQCAPYGD